MKSIFLLTLVLAITNPIVDNSKSIINSYSISENNTILEQLTASYKGKTVNKDQISYLNFLTIIQNINYLNKIKSNLNFALDLTQIAKKFPASFYTDQNYINEKYQQAQQAYIQIFNDEISNFFNKLLMVSMISDIVYYYSMNKENQESNQIINNSINIIETLITEINHENNNSHDHSLINKNGNFLNSLKLLNLNEIINDYKSGKENALLQQYQNMKYDKLNLQFNITSQLTIIMENTMNEAIRKKGYRLNMDIFKSNDFNLNLSSLTSAKFTFNIDLLANIFSPPVPVGGVSSTTYFFRLYKPSLFDFSFN